MEKNAVDSDLPIPLFLWERALLTCSYLTLPLPWPRDVRPSNPESTEPSSFIEHAQVTFPGAKPTVPPLSELALSHSVALLPPPASERHPRWAPAPCLAAARVCPGPALQEEGDDRGPSIRTWSDGPGLSIPFWRLEALTSGPGSAAVWAPHPCATDAGGPAPDRPRSGLDLARR
jgi:hypothetical protein